MGKSYFRKKIKTGVFNYAENEQQLYDIITENKEFVSDDNPFIDTCSDKVRAAMNFIISH